MADLRTRPEIHSPEAAAILPQLCHAFQVLKDNAGSGGYQDIAGIHGLPDFQCLHHEPGWLPWHRLYLLKLEDALRAVDSGLVLPYWDWTADSSIEEGLPAAFTNPTYQPASGRPLPNPLLSGIYVEDGQSKETYRNPGTRSQRQQTADEVPPAMAKNVFADFSETLATLHDDLHSIWVQGSMGDPTYAAYDPIFWAHHANVDRLWAIWQLSTNNDDPDPDTQAQVLVPFNQTVKQTLRFREDLAYTYTGLTTMSSFPPFPGEITAWPGSDGTFSVRNFRFNHLLQRVSLVLQGISTHRGSFRLDVFVNQRADAATPIANNLHFAGSVGIFGMSMPHPGHGSHHAGEVKYDRRLDITHTVAVFTKDNPDFNVTIVARDARGNPVELSRVPIQRILIRAE
jgi:hypothetical protein